MAGRAARPQAGAHTDNDTADSDHQRAHRNAEVRHLSSERVKHTGREDHSRDQCQSPRALFTYVGEYYARQNACCAKYTSQTLHQQNSAKANQQAAAE